MQTSRNISNHQILEEYYPFILKISRRFFKRKDLSYDVANDVYLKLFKQKTDSIVQMIYKGKFEAFIFICVKNHVMDIHNSNKKRVVAEIESLETFDDLPLDEMINNKLNKLTEEDLKFLSIFVNRKTQKEVAAELNMSRKFINTKLKNIRKL